MNKQQYLNLILLFCCLAGLLSSCESDNFYDKKNENVDPNEYFDFSTMYGCPIEIQYDHKTLIKVYDVDPDKNPDAQPVYSTFTEYDGHYKGVMQLPTAYVGKQLWARGFGFEATATIDRNGAKFVAPFRDPRSRASNHITHMYTDEELVAECERLYGKYISRLPESRNNTDRLSETENLAIHTVKDDTEIMMSFVNSGGRFVSQLYYFYFPEEVDTRQYMIDYVMQQAEAKGVEPDTSSLNLRSEFMRIFTDNVQGTNKKFLLTRDWGVFYTGRKQYLSGGEFSTGTDNLLVKDPAGNILTGNGFTDAASSYTSAEINAVKANHIISPMANGSTPTWGGWSYYGPGFVNRNFNNHIGAHHHLRFYGPNYDQYLDEPNYYFPAGYRIGFILKVRDTDTGAISCLTTNNSMNNKNAVQCARNLSISQSDEEKGITNIVYGYEDQLLEKITNHKAEPDYNDFMFLLTATPAVSTEGMERIVEEGELFIDGTLLYEDLFPEAGDYDMNDVMVEYQMWVKFDENNYVTSIESKFWPINYGANYENDFFMELRTDDNKGNVKQFIQPEKVFSAAQLRSMSASNLQDIAAGIRPQKSVIHRHTFKASDKLHKDSISIENFNPFIYVHNTNREVHLTNGHFCGVNNASISGLTPGQLKYYPLMIKDGSPLDGCYFPYAMNVPRRFSSLSMEGFTPVTESVYIMLEYTDFLNWMRDPTNSAYKGWYKNYRKWQGQLR